MGIYVWGTGCGASELIEAGLKPERIAGFVDSFPGGTQFLGRPVLLPEALPGESCQLLVVTARQSDAIEEKCQKLGIPPEKVLYLKNSCTLADKNTACTQAQLLGEEVLSRVLPRQRILTTPAQLSCPRLPEETLKGDYVRLATLELLARNLEELPGAAAELGVYRGFFAGCINRLMPERTLYLFDSFQGFLPEEGAAPSFQAAHENTTAQQVLSSLPHPENVRLMPGFFPESLQGLEDRFCLVSLDVDFPETTLEGLRYFWPRMVPGGCLLVHDWGNPSLPGVRQAVAQYQQELGYRLPAVPLADVNGTLVLCKDNQPVISSISFQK